MSLQSTVSLGRVGRVLGGEVKLPSRQGSKESISRATTPEVKTPTQSADAPVAPTPAPVTCQEPDIVASAKISIQTEVLQEAAEPQPPQASAPEPVAPPRRRRNKAKAPTPPPPISSDPREVPSPQNTPRTDAAALQSPIPVSTSAPSLSTASSTPVEVNRISIASLSKDFECSLDLKSAIKGLYVTKPQVLLV